MSLLNIHGHGQTRLLIGNGMDGLQPIDQIGVNGLADTEEIIKEIF